MAEPRNTPARDSFSDLIGLIKQKKPYTPILQSNPEPKLSLATNNMQSTSSETVDNQSRPLTARRVSGFESVADFLREEEEKSKLTVNDSRPAVYREHDMQRLEALFEKLNSSSVDDDKSVGLPHTPSQRHREPLLIPELESPIHFGPTGLPTPAESFHPGPSPSVTEPNTTLHLPENVWNGMSKDINTLEAEKEALEEKFSKLERRMEALRDEDDKATSRLGLLKYQNEANRAQKAEMGRALNEKDIKIKYQQLEIHELKAKLLGVETQLKKLDGITRERDYLRDTLSSVHDDHKKVVENTTMIKDQEIGTIKKNYDALEVELKRITSERDAATRACISSGDHATKVQNLRETIDTRGEVVTYLRQKHFEERGRAMHLESHLESLDAQTNSEAVDELKEKLREKTAQCDQLRSQLKFVGGHLKLSQERVMKVSNNGDSLRGAAHLVIPHAQGQLPRNVISCSECYANNMTCDSSVCCRSCRERNTQCARWRCSLKHKLGVCDIQPCKLPHDSQGWLILHENRPQW